MSPSEIKPIKLWGKGGPNPPKVAIVLEELGLPYELVPIPLSQVKNADFLEINPNGRIPAIYDPNTDLTLWESGAIVEYLLDTYDKENVISFDTGSNDAYLIKQWLYFQASGQGPYYGQASWFKKFHPEKVQSAVDRYVKEVNRVTGVLESHLAKQAKDNNNNNNNDDEPWLVANKYSAADLAFVSWQFVVTLVVDKEDGYTVDDYPHVKDWLARLNARPAIKKIMDDINPVR